MIQLSFIIKNKNTYGKRIRMSKRYKMEQVYRSGSHTRNNRGRRMRNALRICIMGLAVGIVVLSGCVIGKYLFENGMMKASNPTIKEPHAEVAKGSTDTQKSDGQTTNTDKEQPSNLKTYPSLAGKSIVIDPGHGGTDSGTIGPKTGVYESKLNMQVSTRLKEILENSGVKVKMTRENDGTIDEPTDEGLTWNQRGRAIQKAQADLLISVHHNYNENSKAIHGVQILYRHDDVKDLVAVMQSKFNQELGVINDEIKSEYRVLNYGSQPGIIVECGFLSNRDEEKRLQTAEYQDQLVSIIMDSLVEYYQNNSGS